ncbi:MULTISPECIES: restriction endonuclease subunit S [Faecalibacterium]|uniref:restriction endonuclease subunit S n=1 Tax=Faecalibacterium sp. TaxID=1971605 RepID=UPI003AF03736
MEIQKLKDICLTEITDGTHQTPTYSEYGYIFLSSKNVTTQKIDWDNVMFIPEKLHEELYKRVAPQIDDILLAKNGTTGVAAIVDRDIVFDIYVSLALIRPNTEIVMPRYLLYAINNPVVKGYFDSSLKGIGVPNLHLKNIRETPIKIYDLETQKAIVEKLDKVCELISLRKQQLAKLDELVKARFVEMFGDFKSNSKGWSTVKFDDFAKIDGNMTTDYKKYADYPHIGIDSIEKGTGALKGYRTVKEDGVVSGKYIFTPQHIIYSKIRPNLNKVALPDFEGLCSADAYPILPNPKNCNRIFLALAMRSDYFLDYILQFSARTNLPKVNRKEIAGFSMPLPPLSLQNDFATFVERVDQQKQTVQQSLEKLELVKKALMQEYFG